MRYTRTICPRFENFEIFGRMVNAHVYTDTEKFRHSLPLQCFNCCNLARAQGFQKTNMPPTERSFYLLNSQHPHYLCFFLYNCMQCVDGFSILLQRYVTKGNDAKNPAIFSFCLLSKEPS